MSDIAAVVTAHRAVADLIEQHPDLALPFVYPDGQVVWNLYGFECPDGVPAMVAAIRRAVGDKWDKRESRTIGDADGLAYEREGYRITVNREAVCTRRVVGTETVTLPAVEAQPERTVEREIVEWDCQPILTGAAS